MPLPMILSLDAATVTGWAYGRPGEEPTFGVVEFGGGEGGNGEVISKFRAWCFETCYRLRPDELVFESPYVPHIPKKPDPTKKSLFNPKTLRRLYGIASEIEAVCWELRINCCESTIGEISNFFTGRWGHGGREKKKAAFIARARQYGWNCTDDNEADAVALWAMAEGIFAPELSAARSIGDLTLPMAEPVIVKPRRQRKRAERPVEPVQAALFV